MPNLPLNGRQSNLVIAGSAITFAIAVSFVLLAWWQVEARIDDQIDQKLKPVAEKVDEIQGDVKQLRTEMQKVDRQQGRISGQLDTIQQLLTK